MLRPIVRRGLWLFPSVLGVSFLTFYVLSLVPVSDVGKSSPHARYRELPLFFNLTPKDIRTRVAGAIADIVGAPEGSAQATRGKSELVRLGGAALPLIMQELDALAPEQRVRVALSIAALAKRMGLVDASQAADPRSVVRFWTRFWETSEVEFRQATAKNAARRWARYGAQARQRDLIVLDTFALPAIFDTLPPRVTEQDFAAVRRLVETLGHVTGRNDVISSAASESEAQACLDRWRRWWIGRRAEFVQLIGTDRVAAFALETRYGKWALETLAPGEGGPSPDLSRELGQRGRVTGLLLVLAWLGAYLTAVPLAVLAAAMRARPLDRALVWAALMPHALPTVALAAILLGASDGLARTSTAAAAAALGVGMVASPLRQQRAQLLAVMQEEWTRAALAQGSSLLGASWRNLRSTLMPVVAQAYLELPAALTACFVIERVFGLEGLGEATIVAVAQGQVGWLMALALLAAAWGAAALVVCDLTCGLIDPRVRASLARLAGRA